MLHEASSVAKAIQKAWEEAGRPEDFKIRILEHEKTKFFGLFTENPAVVSISYEPVRHSAQQAGGNAHKKNKQQPNIQSLSDNGRVRDQSKKEARKESPSAHHARELSGEKRQIKELNKKHKQVAGQSSENNKKDDYTKTENMLNQDNRELSEAWSEEQKFFIQQELEALHGHLGITSTYTLALDQKTLHITYAEQLCKSPEEERLFYISLSYLLMQFLKKQYKKRFRGYQILIARD